MQDLAESVKALFGATARPRRPTPAVLIAVSDRTPEPDAVSLTRSGAVVALSVLAPGIATLVTFSIASLGRATGALPTWLVWRTYVVGVVELTNVSIATPTVYVMPAWIALVSTVLLVRRPPHAFELGAATAPS